jgi:hypothetical protein
VRRALALLFLLAAVPLPAAAETLPFTGLLPAAAKTTVIVRQADLPPPFADGNIRLRLGPEGRPYLVADRLLLGLAVEENRTPLIKRIPGTVASDDAAWLADGTFMVIAGKKLGFPKNDGIDVLIELPENEMRLAAASFDSFYLFGGTTTEQRRSLFLYEKGGKLLHLLRMPEPIGAVAGTGPLTFMSVGNVIFRLLPGKKVEPVYRADAPVTALALAGTGGLFFTTLQGAGFVVKQMEGFTFAQGHGPKLAAHGQNLFFYFSQFGVVKISPASSFDSLAETFRETIAERRTQREDQKNKAK